MGMAPKAGWGFSTSLIKFKYLDKSKCWFHFPFLHTKSVWLTFYDVGGGAKIRGIWPNYLREVS